MLKIGQTKKIKAKVLFDQDLLFLKPITTEHTKQSICLPIQSKQIYSTKTQFKFLEDFNLADSGL